MTIAEAVNQADKLCPNTTFSMNEKMEPSHPQPCRSKMVGPFAFAAFV